MLGGPFPLGRGHGFARVFVVCVCWYFWVARFLVLSLGYTRQKENTGNSLLCHPLGLEVPSWSGFFHLSSEPSICFIYNV